MDREFKVIQLSLRDLETQILRILTFFKVRPSHLAGETSITETGDEAAQSVHEVTCCLTSHHYLL